jgi:biotin transporter BioY
MLKIIASLLSESEDQMVLANAVAIAVDGAIVKAQLEPTPSQAKITLQSLAVILAALDKCARDSAKK